MREDLKTQTAGMRLTLQIDMLPTNSEANSIIHKPKYTAGETAHVVQHTKQVKAKRSIGSSLLAWSSGRSGSPCLKAENVLGCLCMAF